MNLEDARRSAGLRGDVGFCRLAELQFELLQPLSGIRLGHTLLGQGGLRLMQVQKPQTARE